MFSLIHLCSTIEQVMALIYGEAEEISVGPASHPEDPGHVEEHGPRRDGARAEGKGVIIWHVIKTLKLVMCIHILSYIIYSVPHALYPAPEPCAMHPVH